MFEQLIVEDEHQMIILKNAVGDFCFPDWDYWGIEYWNVLEGYLLRLRDQDEDATLPATWIGIPVNAQTPIELDAGWSMISYLPQYDLEASVDSDYEVVPEDILENLVIAKDYLGRFMSPDYGFSTMIPWTPGQGYQVNFTDAVDWVYPDEPNRNAAAPEQVELSRRWANPRNTDENMSVLITSILGFEPEDGDQIAAFTTEGRLAGEGTFRDGKCGLAVWGDTKITEDVVEGMIKGEAFELRLWDADKDEIISLGVHKFLEGDGLEYVADGIVVLEATLDAALPDEFYLAQNYPNPFNAVTRLSYGLPEASKVTINVFDVTGRHVTTLVNNELKAGRYTAVWNGRESASGIYIVRMEAANFKSVRKVMLVK
jgi:hypothetical protein